MATTDNHSGLSNSFTDLMTSLAVIFILLLCAMWNNAQQQGQDTRSKIMVDLRQKLQEFIKKQGVVVETDPRDPLVLVVLVPERLVFALNDDTIPEDGGVFLKQFIPRLASTVLSDEFRNEINSIIVEGHADKTGTDEINLPLSQRRSMSVVMRSLNVLEEESEESKEQFISLLSASGRGSSDPYKDPLTGMELMERSRRVVFKIRIKSLEQKDFQTIIGKTANAS